MLNDLYFELGFIMFLNYNRIDRGDAMNFREVNKKLNELKQVEIKAKGEYLLAEFGSEEELISTMRLDESRYQLDQFRNTKISEINFK